MKEGIKSENGMYRLYRILSNQNVMDSNSSPNNVYIVLQYGSYLGKNCGK